MYRSSHKTMVIRFRSYSEMIIEIKVANMIIGDQEAMMASDWFVICVREDPSKYLIDSYTRYGSNGPIR